MLDWKAKGAQDSNLMKANGGACFYKQKSSTFCHDEVLAFLGGEVFLGHHSEVACVNLLCWRLPTASSI
jgi:hypothetical protein